MPHRPDKEEAASKFRTFKGQQFRLAWPHRLGSPVLRSRYLSSSCVLYWVGFIHTSVMGKVWGCRPWSSGTPCPSFQTPCGTHAAPLPRRNDKEGLPSPIRAIHSKLFFFRLFCRVKNISESVLRCEILRCKANLYEV